MNLQETCCWKVASSDIRWAACCRHDASQATVHACLKESVRGHGGTGGSRLVIVTMDLIGITPELRAAVEDLVKGHGVPPESLLMNASHTHCGPELRDDRILRFGIDAKYAALSPIRA